VNFDIDAASHVDHPMPLAVREALFAAVRDAPETGGVSIITVDVGVALPCVLHGPLTGQPAVDATEAFYAIRPPRTHVSRRCNRPAITTRVATIITGPGRDGARILYTMFSGPAAPREPGDTGLSDAERRASSAFWAEHALGDES